MQQIHACGFQYQYTNFNYEFFEFLPRMGVLFSWFRMDKACFDTLPEAIDALAS